MNRSSPAAHGRYSKVAMLFHWVIAALVIANWLIAEAAHDAPGPDKGEIFSYHKSVGITILVLTLGRLAWRIGHKAPPLPDVMAGWEKALARTTHVIFYILLIGLPLGAWIANSLGGQSVDFFGLFTIPPLPTGENKPLGHTIYEAHATGGTIFLWLIALHIAGALKHTFFDKAGGIGRMLPFGKA
jgi:cytochrome b561